MIVVFFFLKKCHFLSSFSCPATKSLSPRDLKPFKHIVNYMSTIHVIKDVFKRLHFFDYHFKSFPEGFKQIKLFISFSLRILVILIHSNVEKENIQNNMTFIFI